ncbi:MAG: cupin [Patescibacteria group bacterium]
MEKIIKIKKPWGQEEILFSDKHYTFKRLILKSGCRTSLQYHRYKTETMYFLSGQGVIEFHYPKIKKTIKNKIKYHLPYTVKPGLIHRITAKNTLLYLEASTSQLKDVVRLEDDYNRIK